MNTIKFLAKVGEYEFMQKLYENGELYFRPLSEFIKMEEKDGVSDKFENLNYYCSIEPASLKMMLSNKVEFSLPNATLLKFAEHSPINRIVYCMTFVNIVKDNETYYILERENLCKINSKYDTLVVIHNEKEFINRIIKAVPKQLEELIYGLVDYYPEINTLKQNLTPFDKRSSFSYQKELRFCFSNFDTSKV